MNVSTFGDIAALPVPPAFAATRLRVELQQGEVVAHGVMRLTDGGAAVIVRLAGGGGNVFRVCRGASQCRTYTVTRMD